MVLILEDLLSVAVFATISLLQCLSFCMSEPLSALTATVQVRWLIKSRDYYKLFNSKLYPVLLYNYKEWSSRFKQPMHNQ